MKVQRCVSIADDEEELEAGGLKEIGAGQMKRQSWGRWTKGQSVKVRLSHKANRSGRRRLIGVRQPFCLQAHK